MTPTFEVHYVAESNELIELFGNAVSFASFSFLLFEIADTGLAKYGKQAK